MKSEPRTRLAPQCNRYYLWQSHKVNRHFAGVAVVFFAGFAFWEVSFTIIVIVHFLIWKVIRIKTTSCSEDGTNRLRVCMNALHCPLFRGVLFYKKIQLSSRVLALLCIILGYLVSPPC